MAIDQGARAAKWGDPKETMHQPPGGVPHSLWRILDGIFSWENHGFSMGNTVDHFPTEKMIGMGVPHL